MADLGGTYDASNGQTMEDRDVLPPGDYRAALVKSEKKDAKTPGNAYINLEFEVMEGPAQGRRFWSMLNLWNQNQQAVDIAQRELNSLCHACGKLKVADTEELHGIPILVKLGVQEGQGNYGPSNRVKSYKPANAAAHQGSTSSPQVAGAGSPGGGAPWRKTA
jgi:hypothetical protein